MRFLAAAIAVLILACTSTDTHVAAPSVGRDGYLVTDDGVRLYYRLVGAGKNIVIVVHGGPGLDHTYMVPTIERLAREHTLVFYDQRGGGRSDAVPDVARLTYAHHVSDLETLRRHLGVPTVALLAHSMGAMVVASYARDYPDQISRLVLIGAPAPVSGQAHLDFWSVVQARLRERVDVATLERLKPLYDPKRWEEAEDPVAICREYYRLLMPAYTANPNAWQELRMDACGAPPEAVRNQRRVTRLILSTLKDFDFRPALTRVTAPTLIVHGTHEPIPVEVPWTWARALPNARVLLVPRSGHFPQNEQAETFLAAVGEFLAGNWPPASEAPPR